MLENRERNSDEIQSNVEDIERLEDEVKKLSGSLEEKSTEMEHIKEELSGALQQVQTKAEEAVMLQNQLVARADAVPLGSDPEEAKTTEEDQTLQAMPRSQKRVEELEEKVRQFEEEEQAQMGKMLEQMELLRMQLREKSELLEACQSDSTLREELEARVEELEIR